MIGRRFDSNYHYWYWYIAKPTHPSSFPNGEGDRDDRGDGDDDGELPIELKGPQDYGVGCMGLGDYQKYLLKGTKHEMSYVLQNSKSWGWGLPWKRKNGLSPSWMTRWRTGGTLILMKFSPYSKIRALTSELDKPCEILYWYLGTQWQ